MRRTLNDKAFAVLVLSVASFVGSMLLPVIHGKWIPGWSVVFNSFLWQFTTEEGEVLFGLFALTLGLSSVLFLPVAWMHYKECLPASRRILTALVGTAILNALWFPAAFAYGAASDLNIGFYLWVASFPLLAVSYGISKTEP